MKNKKGAKHSANEIKYSGEKLSFDQYSHENAAGSDQETEIERRFKERETAEKAAFKSNGTNSDGESAKANDDKRAKTKTKVYAAKPEPENNTAEAESESGSESKRAEEPQKPESSQGGGDKPDVAKKSNESASALDESEKAGKATADETKNGENAEAKEQADSKAKDKDDEEIDENNENGIEEKYEKKAEEAVESRRVKRMDKRRKKRLKVVIGGVVAAVVAVAGGYSIYVNAYDDVLPNVYVENVDVGGMTREEALSAISAEFTDEKILGNTMTFKCEDSTSEILVDNLSLHFETEAMADDAYMYGRESGGFMNKLMSFTKNLFAKEVVHSTISYDQQALVGAINDLCSPYEYDPVGYTYSIGENTLTIKKPTDGLKVNMDEAVAAVEHEIATFNYGELEFTPEPVSPPEFDLDAFYNEITSAPTDATYAKDENGDVVVVPGKPQVVVSKSDVEGAVNQPEQEFTMKVQTINPPVDAEYLKSIMYEDRLGTYSTDYSGSSGARSNNIARACESLNGVELLPGEEFSYDQTLGQRTAAAGYLPAPVYVVKGGETVSEMDYGGGICQVSSTLYCAALNAGLEITERHSHSKPVGYVPAGMDATVSWQSVDLKFVNNTDYPIKIAASAGGGIVTTSFYGSNASEPNYRLETTNDGNMVTVTRVTTNADGTETREVVSTSDYANADIEATGDELVVPEESPAE